MRTGRLGVMDYYRLKNIEADTDMRESFSRAAKPEGEGAGVAQRVMNRDGLDNRHKPGHPDAYLNAILDYTAGFYAA
ncbi:flotillin-like FloA family protein, partial [Acinetobacter baumannii]